MIIDFHTHVFPDKIAQNTIKLLSKNGSTVAHSDGTVDGLKKALSSAKINMAVALPVLTKPEQFSSVFAFAELLNNEFFNANGKILSFAGIHPRCDDIPKKMKAVKDAGFLGVKIHPDYQRTYFDDEGYECILRCAKDNDLIVVSHSGVDGAYLNRQVMCTADKVLRVLKNVGDVKLVLAHNGCNELGSDVYNLLAGKKIYFDTAYNLRSFSQEQFSSLVAKHGEDRILFASDSPWRNISDEVKILKSMKLNHETEQKIFFKNALSLLGERVARKVSEYDKQ